jgi:peptidoglycan/LPS O-acetylase OafA/YrhL
MRLCVLVFVLSPVLRVLLLPHIEPAHQFFALYESTYTRCDALIAGAWLALWLREKPLSRTMLRRISLWVFIVGCLLFVGGHELAARYAPAGFSFVLTFGFTCVALIVAGVLLRSFDDSSRLSRVLRNRYLNELGIVSYGFYFIHHLPLHVWPRLAYAYPRLRFFVPLIAFAVTFVLAELSFRYWESPFLRLKSVLAPQDGGSSRRPAHLHVPQPQPEEHAAGSA